MRGPVPASQKAKARAAGGPPDPARLDRCRPWNPYGDAGPRLSRALLGLVIIAAVFVLIAFILSHPYDGPYWGRWLLDWLRWLYEWRPVQ